MKLVTIKLPQYLSIKNKSYYPLYQIVNVLWIKLCLHKTFKHKLYLLRFKKITMQITFELNDLSLYSMVKNNSTIVFFLSSQ